MEKKKPAKIKKWLDNREHQMICLYVVDLFEIRRY